MVIRYRYSEWDGAQEIPPLDPDDVLNALTDDLMNFGDLQHALRNLLQKLQELVRKAHERNLKVILDVVPNHVGTGHPWLSDGAHAGWFPKLCPLEFPRRWRRLRGWMGTQ